MTAFGAFEKHAAAFLPHPLTAASRTGRLAAPPRIDPIGAAVFLSRKALLERDRRLRKVSPKIVTSDAHVSPLQRRYYRLQSGRIMGIGMFWHY